MFQGMPRPAARSAYLRQVERIAEPDPPGLLDREAELAELASFCLAPDGFSYAWWRAEPWAGKSALLSAFVLRPPAKVADRVRIVSFFITARLGAQDTREAFTEVVLEQLAAFLGQPLPAVLPEATREAYLLDLMSQAAVACQSAGRRLVLVVDGLDEDRGVTAEPDAHSIAGLLPTSPPAGMRVIVAGRPNPPVPDDVPDGHPLRDPAIVRPLSASAHARDRQRLGRQELQRLLLRGSPAEQALLGLLTAARGGLSAWDLAELSGAPRWEVEGILRTVAGRAFSSRPSLLDPPERPDVYLLAHEELQAAAVDYLGDRLDGYRERLHSWADRYRDRKWPSETPEYPLSGYFRLLENLGDLPRMTECALDPGRHDRMLDLTGGDAAALTETRVTLDRIAAQDMPDLASALALARHRDHLIARNFPIPVALPAVWAILGQVPRARALAGSVTDPNLRVSALVKLAEALAKTGQVEQAVDLAKQAEAAARSIAYPHWQARALADFVRLLAATGQLQDATDLAGQTETVARSITHRGMQALALAKVAEALAWARQHQQAEAIARSIADPTVQASALAEVAEVLARTGHDRQAENLAGQVELIIGEIADPYMQETILAGVAGTLAWAGQVRRAEEITRSITNSYFRATALAEITGALASTGQVQQAEVVARSIGNPTVQAGALAEVAGALAGTGQVRQAKDLAEEAEAIARSVTGLYFQALPLAEVAGALAGAGQCRQAEAIARSITDPGIQVSALAEVAGALAETGRVQQAEELAEEAGATASSLTDPYAQGNALAKVAVALVLTGQARRAESTSRCITDQGWQATALAWVAGALARTGQVERAEAVARSITDPVIQVSALANVAEALAETGQVQQAKDYAEEAEATARSISHLDQDEAALAEAAGALAAVGQAQRAEAVARSIANPEMQGGALVEVAVALAETGQVRQAEAITRSITDRGLRASAWSRVAATLASRSPLTGHQPLGNAQNIQILGRYGYR